MNVKQKIFSMIPNKKKKGMVVNLHLQKAPKLQDWKKL